jgi:Tol biopolymer transport system component
LYSACILSLVLISMLPVRAQRLPVLRQIDLPYSIYCREMYLPQLTSGPSSVAWMPDSESVIFSMQGALWRQRLDSSTAEQLTAGPGYDYQPDVSPDGRWVVYAKYNQDAIELWLLDLSTRQSKQLTNTSAVNVEPRWSPAFKNGDTRIVFVSSQFNQRLHIFVAQFDPAKAELKEVQRLTAETHSHLPRILYSEFDHEISPSWSPDGKEIIFVSNHQRRDGAGGFWRMKSTPVLVEPSSATGRGPFGMMSRRLLPIVKEESHQILDEKTTWRVRPDWSPDGKRVIYAMYLAAGNGGGRYVLRTVSADGGEPQMLSDVDEDRGDFNPRWSPDGKSVAFISTQRGKFSLWVRGAAGAHLREIAQNERKFLAPMATMHFENGAPARTKIPSTVSIRVSVTGDDGRAYAPDSALIYAEDGFDRKERPFELHYFDLKISSLRPSEAITVPSGKIHVEITHGFEYRPISLEVETKAGENKVIPVKLQPLRLSDSPTVHWIGGDLHVSADYGSAYRNQTQLLLDQMKAEDLGVGANLMVFHGEQIPDVGTDQSVQSLAPALAAQHILYGAEFESAFRGNVDVLNTNPPPVHHHFSYLPMPGGVLPLNASIADKFHSLGKDTLLGYTHLFEDIPNPNLEATLTHELPMDVALGKVDYYEAVDSRDPKSSAAVWYSLLNLGFRLPVAAGSDAVAGYASSRGPVGRDRVYVRVPMGPFRIDSWLNGLRQGRSFASNGPLLRFTLGGQQVGGELKLPAPRTVRFTAALRSMVPVDHLQIVCNGEVALNVPLNQTRDASNAVGGLHLARSGWCLARAWADKTEDPVLDDYPYATTSPIYVTVAGAKPRSPRDAAYFTRWMERLKENEQAASGYRNEEEKARVLKLIDSAHKIYEQLAR